MEENEKFATYKEFAKMLREVADIYSQLGDEPLLQDGARVQCNQRISPGDNQQTRLCFLHPALEGGVPEHALQCDEAKKWIAYVNECYRVGKEVDYDKIDEL